MDWHIITSGKGGVGKTLLSLMLLTYFQQNRNKFVFVVDLNGVNADLRRLCCVEDEELFHPINITTSSGKQLDLICYRVNFEDQDTQYVVGWPSNPYKMLCESSDFFDFLVQLKKATFDITGRNVFKPDTIIIDTNFHFCNILSDDKSLYKKNNLLFSEDDNFFIWFIWVYRQLRNLFLDSPNNDNNENEVLIKITKTIEEHLTNRYSRNPFIHVFNAYNVDIPSSNSGKTFFNKVFRNNSDIFESKELKNLLIQDSGRAVNFENMYKGLKNVKPKEHYADVHELFLNILNNYAEKHKKCPINMVPIPTYDKRLAGYTDASFKPENLINAISNLDIFKHFLKSIERLLEMNN